MPKISRSRKASGRKKTAKTTTTKKTTKNWAPRTRGYVTLTNKSQEHGYPGKVCQVLKINNDKTKIAVRYNYNGQDIVVPYDSVIKPPDDWRKKDPVNINYKKPFENPLKPFILKELNS